MIKQELQVLVGSNLLRARTEQRLTREQIAERVGISTTFYANLESGNKMMSLVTLRKLAEALHISTDYLLFGDSTPVKAHNAEMLLRSIPEENLPFVEKMLRLCIDELQPDQGTNFPAEEQL